MEKAHTSELEVLQQDTLVLKENKAETSDMEREIYELKEIMASMSRGTPVEVRASSPQGPKITQADIDRWNAGCEKAVTLEGAVDKLVKETRDLETIRDRVKEIRSKLSEFVLKEEFL